MVDQHRALDNRRFGDGPLAALTTREMAAVEKSLLALVGIYSKEHDLKSIASGSFRRE